MDDLLKKTIHKGVGMAYRALEHLEKTMDEWIGEGKISEEEGKKIVDSWKEDAAKWQENFESGVKTYTKAFVDRINAPSREELEQLKQRIEELELLLKNQQKSNQQ